MEDGSAERMKNDEMTVIPSGLADTASGRLECTVSFNGLQWKPKPKELHVYVPAIDKTFILED
jgi:hypothetical protein